MGSSDSRFGLKLEYVIGVINIIFIILNAYMIFIATPKQVENEFIERWKLSSDIYETIAKNNGMARDELYRKMMDKYPKETAESITAKIASTLTELSLARLIEENDNGEFVQAPTMREFLAYIESPSYQKDIILEKVKRISYNNCYKYTVKEIYDQIDENISIEYDHFEMIVYSNVRYPQVPPFMYDGYIIDSEGKVCHLAAKKSH